MAAYRRRSRVIAYKKAATRRKIDTVLRILQNSQKTDTKIASTLQVIYKQYVVVIIFCSDIPNLPPTRSHIPKKCTMA